ncbi:ionotropic receptor 21a-like [Cherax quadricarinatus]|uniref:ionotropic receptor 21a-like n=1 Tax=Cherax quadricarinatus TaxID=27406 RepID=UPI00387E6E4C
MTQPLIVSVVATVLTHTVLHTSLVAGGILSLHEGEHGKPLSPYWSAAVVLEAAIQPRCSGIVIHDAKNLPSADFIWALQDAEVEVDAKVDAEVDAKVDAEAEVDAKVDAEAEVDAKVDAEAEVDAKVDAEVDAEAEVDAVAEGFDPLWASWGVAVFQVANESQDANVMQAQLSYVIAKAKQLRHVSWCVTVVVVSDNADFLTTFAECSLKGRLLVWSTRLLAVTRLPLPQLQQLLSAHWTFSMMNAMLVILNEKLSIPSISVYVNLPYSVSGARIVRTGIWTADRGLRSCTNLIYPEKYHNFYGATVNVTALPYKPFWSVVEEQSGNGTGVTRYSGSDSMMLRTIADVLNFTFNVLPVTTWDQVTDLVMQRSSFMASITYMVLPQRLLLYDYTFIYIQGLVSFSMATPSLTFTWKSLFDPLEVQVWVSILVALLLVPPCLVMITRPIHRATLNDKLLTIGDSAEIAVGTLLGQSTKKQLPESSQSRLLLVTWLVFAFIVSNVYRGNLTAALTLPKYPPRPETLEQLVKVSPKVMMPEYGEKFKQFFKQSDSAVYQSLSNIMEIIPSAEYGLSQAVEKNKQAYMDSFFYLQQMIADYFTLVDGSTKLYISREGIIPALHAWPVPHDAPYKLQLDKLMMSITDAGLYQKWINDMILRAKEDSRRRQREEQETGPTDAAQSAPVTRGNQALTLVHMQGPLMMIALGLSSSMLVFITELIYTAMHGRSFSVFDKHSPEECLAKRAQTSHSNDPRNCNFPPTPLHHLHSSGSVLFTPGSFVTRKEAGPGAMIRPLQPQLDYGKLPSPYQSAAVVLDAALRPRCSGIIIHDAKNSPSANFIGFDQLWASWGMAVFQVAAESLDANVTQTQLSFVVSQAMRVRHSPITNC